MFCSGYNYLPLGQRELHLEVLLNSFLVGCFISTTFYFDITFSYSILFCKFNTNFLVKHMPVHLIHVYIHIYWDIRRIALC